MKNNIQGLLKRDLEVIPLIAYFIFYFLYLLFDRILEQPDYAVLVKPIIIPIIAFLYLSNKNSKRTLLNIILLVLIFISDNSTLLEIRAFHVYATIIYMLSIYVLFYYAVLDMKYCVKKQLNKNIAGIVILSIFGIILFYWFLTFKPNDKIAEKFIVFEYMIVFLLLFLLSFFNYVQQKSRKTKYLFLTILCIFLSELCFSIHHYYNGHIAFKYLICIVEVPVYYFLLKYLLRRDKEVIEQ
ncbi:MAG: hypothetical protein V4666_02955 [Bacteroidota bacterium]